MLRNAIVASPTEAVTPPLHIGPYRIEREIGRGGMGVVYLAERDDPTFQHRIALKVVRTTPLDGGASVARFLAERQLLVSLEHPHIARLFDGGVTTDGRPYYTMRYCEGGSLADRLRDAGAIPVTEALRITREVASALAAAHARGVVHRDVKPANVLFDAEGAVRLSDFGVAKLLGADSTTSDTILGTVAYLAPEQVRGEPVDHRADLWALGVTLYEMIVGRRPFDGPSYAAVMHAIVAAPVPAAVESRPDVPVEVQAVIDGLLQKDPARRTGSAAAVIDALDRIDAGQSGQSGQSGRRPAATRGSLTTTRRRAALLLGGTVTLLAMIAGTILWSRGSRVAGTPQASLTETPTPKRLAVMPFTNTSGDQANEPFVDGLTDELIDILGRTGLQVTARSSVFALKGKQLDARRIADTLDVDHLLDGSVRRAGNRLRVFAQLVRASDGAAIWSDQYDRAYADVFDVQQDIARAIAGALRVQLVPGSGARPTADPEAYEMYMKGRYALNSRSGPDDLARAVKHFEDAIARDSNYARAYSGLSDAWALVANFGYDRPRPSHAKARAAALRALALDSTLAEARTSLGHTLCTHDFAWAESERQFRRALDQDPGYVLTRITYAICLMSTGRFAEAVTQLETARKTDPLRPAVGAVLGRVYVNWGRPDEAIAALDHAIDLNPQADLAWQMLGHAYLLKGQNAEAIAALQKAAVLSGLRDSAQLAYAYAVTGDRATARQIVRELLASSDTRYIPPYHIAMAYAGLGQVDEAFHWLERAYEERASFTGGVKITQAFAPLHGDPRWRALLARMGLEP
jgi:serine/threonine-protein kinase